MIEADVRDLPFDDGDFDLVIDFGTCYHVSGGRKGAQRALREIARVLSPGGHFVHETPVAQHLAHPIRSFGRTLPWNAARDLIPDRAAVLWSVRRKVGLNQRGHVPADVLMYPFGHRLSKRPVDIADCQCSHHCLSSSIMIDMLSSMVCRGGTLIAADTAQSMQLIVRDRQK